MKSGMGKTIASAAGLCAWMALGLAGCGGKSEQTDTGTVTVTEPSATPSTSAPSGGGSGSSGGDAIPATPNAAARTAEGALATSGDVTAGKAEGWGTLKGRVVFGGDAPAAKLVVTKGDMSVKDFAICATRSIPSDRLVVDLASKGVRFALVYIPRPTRINPEADRAALDKPVEFDQKGCRFEPHVIAMMKGSKVVLKSSDAVGHNINSRLQNWRFNQTIQPNASIPEVLKQSEVRPGEVVCDIHPWMKSWWIVLNSPYFAVTDAQGNFEIKNAPAGDQKVVVWQEALNGFVTSPSGDVVNIKASADTTKDFTIDPSKVKPD